MLALLRTNINIGFVERPLAIGFLWAIITGEWELALPAAIFYELFWLDLFPVGTYIPPNGTAALLATLASASFFSLTTPSQLIIPMMLAMPAALISPYLEQTLRQRHNTHHNQLLSLATPENVIDEQLFLHKIITKALLQTVAANFIFFALYLLVLICTISASYSVYGSIIEYPGVSWSYLWFFAALGGVLSLRVRSAYYSFFFFLFAVVLITNL
ncbi:MAG: PTS sugar transporter subunit IIC [Halodesulfovibrio sp.]|nr:PTS sugar transporter subunit IIC [Halodesulfovibrio sp.]MCT4627836.1 PTS sugar transporter subunit IIC [Halodesulfovibrio sp.]